MSQATPVHLGSPVLPPRFWTKVEASPDGCWLWVAGKTSTGYGAYTVDDTNKRAHRVSFEALVGEIPDGLVLDHLCRVRACVNPRHLEPVTHRTNILRGEAQAALLVLRTRCIRGHEFTPANTRMDGSKRRCRACKRERTREERAAKAVAA